MVKNILFISVLFLLLDSIYLNLISNKASKMIYNIQKSKMELNLLGAIICYMFIVVLFYHFIIVKKGSLFDAFLLGLCVYGIYDATNYALIKNWSLTFSMMDTLWGGVLFASVFYIYKRILKR